MSHDADVLVLGAGVVGLACAHYLLSEGRSVRVLDAGKVGAATSWGNCGTLTPSHAAPLAAPGMVGQALRWMLRPDAPLYIRPRWDPALARWLGKVAGRCNTRHWRESGLAKGALLKYSRVLVEDLVFGQDLDCGFEAGGLHYVFRSARALARHRRELPLLAELGIPARTLDGEALGAAYGRIYSQLNEGLGALRVIKSLGREDRARVEVLSGLKQVERIALPAR